VVARDTREKSLELRALMSLYRLARAGAAAWTEQTRGDLMRTYGWFTEGLTPSTSKRPEPSWLAQFRAGRAA
jgi:hypothetical protein